MADRSEKKTKAGMGDSRKERLRAALRANLGRRKAQAKARKDADKGVPASDADIIRKEGK